MDDSCKPVLGCASAASRMLWGILQIPVVRYGLGSYGYKEFQTYFFPWANLYRQIAFCKSCGVVAAVLMLVVIPACGVVCNVVQLFGQQPFLLFFAIGWQTGRYEVVVFLTAYASGWPAYITTPGLCVCHCSCTKGRVNSRLTNGA